MVDVVDSKTRSRIMASIRGKNTKPELVVRKALHRRGFRFRLHAKDVPGRPDLVFRKFNAVVFVHGCFWHRHEGCRHATVPATRTEYWTSKFERNVARDDEVRTRLIGAGWRVATVWECALRKAEHVDVAIQMLASWLAAGGKEIVIEERRMADLLARSGLELSDPET
ncbi:MAG: DNA mismatch endonuclease Vsr [Boseongicola sp. SB0662_bin_57]|nr:DNA mismatch endonuclease Vsr [Boseongicola sp. SB0662_bin_57]